MPVRLATRGSPQALGQATAVAAALTACSGEATELVIIETTGDRRNTEPLHAIGGQGVFTKEVQLAVLDGRADAAVHSAKDLPTLTLDGLTIGAFCTRRDPADALIGRSLADLAPGATVASGSVRRRAQLAAERPDLRFVELRGNIGRRLEQIPEDGAIVMACAALEILGRTELITERLDPDRFVPAVGQGCVALECRSDDQSTLLALTGVDSPQARAAVELERAFLAEIGSGCSLPVAAHAVDTGVSVFLAGSDTFVPDVAPTVFRAAVDRSGDHARDLAAVRAAAHRAAEAVGRS